MVNLYKKLDEDKDAVLVAAGANDDWRIYEREGSPVLWAVARLLGERGQAVYGAKGLYSLSEARAWASSDAGKREAISMAVEASDMRERLLDDIRNDVADAGYRPDDENSWWIEPRHQVKRLIEAHRGLRTVCRDLQATNQGLLTDIEELQRLQKEVDLLQWALDEVLRQNDELSTDLKAHKDLVRLNAGTEESVRRQEFIAKTLVYMTLFNVVLFVALLAIPITVR